MIFKKEGKQRRRLEAEEESEDGQELGDFWNVPSPNHTPLKIKLVS